MRTLFLIMAGLVSACALSQVDDTNQPWTTIGMREIDKLPRSGYAESLYGTSYWYGSTRQVTEPLLVMHAKPSFRAGDKGLERLCLIEAAMPADRARTASIQFECDWGSWEHAANWLAPKPQFRAIWLPVTARPIRAALVRDGETLAKALIDTGEQAPAGVFEVCVPDEPIYVDHGRGLMPASSIMAYPGQKLSLRFSAGPGQAGDCSVAATLTDRREQVCGNWEWSVWMADGRAVPGRAFRDSIDTGGLVPGEYQLRVNADLPSGALTERVWKVVVVARGQAPGFAAQGAKLDYDAPVYISKNETRSWDNLWEGSKLQDLVVSFPGSPYRFVFWRGTSYVPCWAFNNSWLTYEWFEAEPDFHGAVDCVEPIMDKGCEYSRVRVAESSPARIVVHWSYALTDFEQKIINNERADEYYYLYPDAVGTRKLVGWMKNGWHENQEFIVCNRPGNAPHEAIEPQAVTFLTVDGKAERATWPRPYVDVANWPHIIAKVNIPGQASPFMVVDTGTADVKVWSEPYADKPGLFNTYIHWPVSRGIRTAWLDDPADWHRPTHSNLVNIVHDPAITEEDHRIWYWLIGVSDREKDIREFAGSWLNPGQVDVIGGQSTGYERAQRAYIVQADPAARELEITVSPERGAIVNPAFVIKGAPRHIGRGDCAGAKRVELGRESSRDDLVVWVEGRFEDAFTLKLH